MLFRSIQKFKRNKRLTNIVSRGGSIIFAWMEMTGEENPFYQYFDEVLEICEKYDDANHIFYNAPPHPFAKGILTLFYIAWIPALYHKHNIIAPIHSHPFQTTPHPHSKKANNCLSYGYLPGILRYLIVTFSGILLVFDWQLIHHRKWNEFGLLMLLFPLRYVPHYKSIP